MNALDNAAVKVGKIKKQDLKPKTHHFFYAVVWLAGWLAPPLAVAIRFGIGKDFFINVLCTICGYFPGHFHNFYCQTIRNNQNAARTPKWAVKYGLVKVKDKRGGKHQWAGRYDERLPDSSRNDYADASTSSVQDSGEWDGHGPETPKNDRRHGNGSEGMHRGSFWQPWDAEVDPDEVQGGPRPPPSNGNGNGRTGGDPFENEEFYASGDQTGGDNGAKYTPKKKKGIKGLMGNRDRYDNPSSGGGTGDRFSKMRTARGEENSRTGGGGGGGDGYEDDFERELNAAKKASLASAGAGSGGAYDDFEREVPEDPLRSQPPARRQEPQQTGGTREGTRADDDLFNHTF